MSSKTKKQKLLSPYEKVQEKRRLDRERWEKIRQIALEQGFALIQISPRRYLVSKLDTVSAGRYSVVPHGGFWTYLGATVVCGPTTWEECRRWIAENSEPLPEELQ